MGVVLKWQDNAITGVFRGQRSGEMGPICVIDEKKELLLVVEKMQDFVNRKNNWEYHNCGKARKYYTPDNPYLWNGIWIRTNRDVRGRAVIDRTHSDESPCQLNSLLDILSIYDVVDEIQSEDEFFINLFDDTHMIHSLFQ